MTFITTKLEILPDFVAEIDSVFKTPEDRLRIMRDNADIDARLWTEWLTNLALNSNVETKSIKELRNKFENKKSIIIGAGPSLKNKIEQLKNIDRNEYIVIACDRAFEYLKDNGIRPDYTVTGDSSIKIANYLPQDKIDKEDKFVFLVVTHKAAVDKALGAEAEIYFYACQNPYSVLWSIINRATDFAFESLLAGYCVGYEATQLAIWLGSKEIYLLGLDFSWDEVEELENVDKNSALLYRWHGDKLTHNSFECGVAAFRALPQLFPNIKFIDCSDGLITQNPYGFKIGREL